MYPSWDDSFNNGIDNTTEDEELQQRSLLEMQVVQKQTHAAAVYFVQLVGKHILENRLGLCHASMGRAS